MFKRFIAILISISTIFMFISCNKDSKQEVLSRTELFMGTAIKISLYDGGTDEILDKAFTRVREIENLVSINKEGTELDKLNENAGIKPVKLSDDSLNIISKGLEYSALADGGYDISVGPLVKLWSIGLPEARVPEKSEIDSTLNLINYRDVKLDLDNKEAYLTKKGMILDLGSIAKGYAADEITKILQEEGIKKAIIDLGGNIYALGKKSDESDWKIGLQNPFSDRGDAIASLKIADKSVVTTGVYERFIEKNGEKYHHVLNPKTGYPYETDIAGVTIIADKSIDADALSTLVFTKGIKEGLKFIESLENVDAVFITNDKKVYKTSGLKDNFEIINSDFKLTS